MGTPHTDTDYDASASFALALLGLLFVGAVFTLPWMFDPGPYDQVRVVTVPPVAKGEPVPATAPPGLYPSLADLRTPSNVVNV